MSLGKGKKNFPQKLYKYFSSRLLTNGEKGGAKRGQSPPQNMKRALCAFAKTSRNHKERAGGTEGSSGYLGFVPASLLNTSLPLLPVRQMVVHAILDLQATV